MILVERPMLAGGIEVMTWMTQREGDRLAHYAPGSTILEIGSAYGYSAIRMAAAGAWHVWTVDNHEERGDTLQGIHQNLLVTGHQDKVTMIVARSTSIFTKLANTGWQFDVVFVDGDHTYLGVKSDLLGALEVLVPGGVLLVHDFAEDTIPGPRRALAELYPEGPDLVTDTLWEKTI